MTNLNKLQEFMEILLTQTDEQIAEYMNNEIDYTGEELYGGCGNFYPISEDYSIEIPFNNEDIYKTYYNLHYKELMKDLKEANLKSENELIEKILAENNPEDIADFYQKNFEEIDVEIAREYINENKLMIIKELEDLIY